MLNNSTNASDLEGGNETEVAGLDCPRFDDAAMKMVEGFSFWYKIKHLRNLFLAFTSRGQSYKEFTV